MYILNSFVLQFKYIEGLLITKLYNNKMKKKTRHVNTIFYFWIMLKHLVTIYFHKNT